MRHEAQTRVFYCSECGHISDTCIYVSSVREWGSVFHGRYGLDYESNDSETNATWHKCGDCNYEWIARGEFDEAQMTYAEALMAKYNDHGCGEFSGEEQKDFDEIHGEQEPPEPREGRNTLKCPEEVSDGA